MNWCEDVKRADIHARSHARQPGCPPHWNRCNYVDEAGERCKRLDGHDKEHEALVPKADA